MFIPLVLAVHFPSVSDLETTSYQYNLGHVLFDLGTALVALALTGVMIYLMFKWTTAYNLANFGHKSKGEWKRVNDTADSP